MRRILENRLEARVVSLIESGFARRIEVSVRPEQVQDKEDEKAEKKKIRAPFPFLEAREKVFKTMSRHEEEAKTRREDELLWETERRENVVEESKERSVFSKGQGCADDEDQEPKEHALPEPGQKAQGCQRDNDRSRVKG
jgi:hypothetical protein